MVEHRGSGEPPRNRYTDSWHIIKGIPVAVLLMLAIQTAGYIWSAATLWSKVDNTAAGQAKINGRLDVIDAKIDGLKTTVLTSGTPVAVNSARLERVETQVDDLTDKVNSMQIAAGLAPPSYPPPRNAAPNVSGKHR